MSILFLAVTAHGFDGQRKGFVLGGGVGFSPYSMWSVTANGTVMGHSAVNGLDESKTGAGVQIIIGYAWDEYNMIVYEGNVTGYKSSMLLDNNSAQGFSGVAYYRYFGPAGRAFFLTGGVGTYAWKVKEYEANDPGFGYIAGAGYEFIPHVQAGAYISGGKTSTDGADFGHTHVNIVITAVAF